MRKVIVSEKNWKNQITEKGIAEFHQFGIESGEDGQMNSMAIIEWPNGQVEMVYPYLIRFVDK